jgi:hypothetical protein
MTADDFVSAIDGLTFDERGRTWTLEVDDVDDDGPDGFVITVCVPEAEVEMYVNASRSRMMSSAVLREQVVGIAREMINGRRRSGARAQL